MAFAFLHNSEIKPEMDDLGGGLLHSHQHDYKTRRGRVEGQLTEDTNLMLTVTQK